MKQKELIRLIYVSEGRFLALEDRVSDEVQVKYLLQRVANELRLGSVKVIHIEPYFYVGISANQYYWLWNSFLVSFVLSVSGVVAPEWVNVFQKHDLNVLHDRTARLQDITAKSYIELFRLLPELIKGIKPEYRNLKGITETVSFLLKPFREFEPYKIWTDEEIDTHPELILFACVSDFERFKDCIRKEYWFTFAKAHETYLELLDYLRQKNLIDEYNSPVDVKKFLQELKDFQDYLKEVKATGHYKKVCIFCKSIFYSKKPHAVRCDRLSCIKAMNRLKKRKSKTTAEVNRRYSELIEQYQQAVNDIARQNLIVASLHKDCYPLFSKKQR